MLRFVLFLSFAFGLFQTATAGVVRIADGDCAGLRSTVAAATSSPSPSTTILLARRGHYNTCNVTANAGTVEIDGQGAELRAFSLCLPLPDNAYVPTNGQSSKAAVTLRNVSLVPSGDFSSGGCASGTGGGMFGTSPTFSSIFNTGTLILDTVTVLGGHDAEGNPVPPLSGVWYAGFLASNGTLIMRNVTIANLNQPSAFPNENSTGSIINSSGHFEIYNSTFANNTVLTSENAPVIHASQALIANSLFVGTTSPACSNSVTSLGGNVATDSSCGFSAAAGDKIDSAISLPVAAEHGGLIHTVQIGFGNPAYRAGVAQYCEATDARGVTRNAANCDAGAYESGGGLGLVTSNGMNGIYYVPGIANGHYVSVQRIHDNNDVMVFWDTFDSNGNPAWIFGVGTLTSDRHIHVPMYRNLGGVLQPGGPATGAKSSAWGTVDIDLTSCSAAQFSYQSSLPEFGSGQFPLTRLAFESAINCGD